MNQDLFRGKPITPEDEDAIMEAVARNPHLIQGASHDVMYGRLTSGGVIRVYPCPACGVVHTRGTRCTQCGASFNPAVDQAHGRFVRNGNRVEWCPPPESPSTWVIAVVVLVVVILILGFCL